MEFFDSMVPDFEGFDSEKAACAPSCPSASAIGGSSLDGHGTTVEPISTDVLDNVVSFSVGSSSSGVDPSVYDRTWMESHFSNSQAALPKFCREEGILGEIFGSEGMSLPNILSAPLHQPDVEPVTMATSSVGTLKRKSDDSHYTAAVKVINDTDFLEQQKQLWNSALCKWQTIFCIVHQEGPVGNAIWKATMSGHPRRS